MEGSCGRALSNNFTLRQLAGWCLRASVTIASTIRVMAILNGVARAIFPVLEGVPAGGLAIALVGLQAALKPANTSGDDKDQKQILK